MKYYNPKFIKQYIAQHQSEIEEVELGMDEDWSWTAETIFERGKFSRHHNLGGDRVEVAGIVGSVWATPIMAVTFKDGHVERVECWVDDDETVSPADIAKRKAFAAATGGLDRRFS